MYPATNARFPYRLVLIIVVLVGVLSLFMVGAAIQTVRTSGKLVITTPNKDSLISISQTKRSAASVGTGNASLRLAPGTYLVGVARQGRFSGKVVSVTKGQTTYVNMSSTTQPRLPSSANISFLGTEELIARGMTTAQIHALREAIFAFNKNIQVASVVSGSVQSGPYDPGSTSPLITRTFSLLLDGQPYSATASWVGLDTATLTLRDGTGNVVFDSAAGHD